MKQPERIAWITIVVGIIVWNTVMQDEPEGEVSRSPEAATRSHGRDRPSRGEQDDSPRAGRGREAVDRSGVEARSLRALRSPDPLTRLSEFLKVLADADTGNFDQVATALEGLKASGISLPVEEDLLHFRAGQLRGAELMAEHTGSSGDFAMIGTLKKQYEGWIQADAHGAGRWLEGLQAGKFRDQMAVSYIAACTKDDPAGSFKLVSSLHPSQQEAAGKAVAKRLSQSTSAEEASSLLRALEANAGGAESRYLSSLFETLASGAGKNPHAVTLSLVEDNFDQPYVTGVALSRVSAEKARTDPHAALEWAASMEGRKDDIPHGAMVAATINGMTLEGLKSARKWAETQQDGTAYWLDVINKREGLLEDEGGDNDYDKDD